MPLKPCCDALKEAMAGGAFEPLIAKGEEDDIVYIAIGIVDEEDEPGMVEHPLFYCPFCGTQVQTPEEVAEAIGDEGDDEDDDK